jgi:hypothetical protein
MITKITLIASCWCDRMDETNHTPIEGSRLLEGSSFTLLYTLATAEDTEQSGT